MAENPKKAADVSKAEATPKPTCGVVMPISEMDGYPESHWSQVFLLIQEVGASAGYDTRIVSESPEVGVIQRRIVNNLYYDDIVIVDVSGRNPNVMFELGLRLAFDKPTIIIQDDITKAPFDTSIIEYLEYPRTLHYYDIISFRSKLAAKMAATAKRFKDDPGYSTFLKHFGEFRPAEIAANEVSGFEFVSKELRSLREEFAAERAARQKSQRQSGQLSLAAIDTQMLTDSERQRMLQMLDGMMPDGSMRLELSGNVYQYQIPRSPSFTDMLVRAAASNADLSDKLVGKDGSYEFMPF